MIVPALKVHRLVVVLVKVRMNELAKHPLL